MNLRRGFRRITLILAILVGIICGTTAIGMLIEKRSSELRHLDECEKEFIGSIPVADPNERPAGWPKWNSDEQSRSDYLKKLSIYLSNKYWNLPVLYGEEDKKYREEHNIPPDSTKRFYTEESTKFMETYGNCVKKAHLLIDAQYTRWATMPSYSLVLTGFCYAIGGFCGTWLVYGIIGYLVIPLVFWVSKGFHKDTG